jgi:hypothetical protein
VSREEGSLGVASLVAAWAPGSQRPGYARPALYGERGGRLILLNAFMKLPAYQRAVTAAGN